ncbi:MAG TPA: hypothetical protein VHI95_11645 [Acidimicrobiales bacterium]|nr:hypothetical protein [Acidimicrobiales bacterium]
MTTRVRNAPKSVGQCTPSSGRLTRRARTYHMLTNTGIADAIRSHRTRLIALSAQMGHLGKLTSWLEHRI